MSGDLDTSGELNSHENYTGKESRIKIAPLSSWFDTALQTLIVQSSPFQREFSSKRSKSTGGIVPVSPIAEESNKEEIRLTQSMHESLMGDDDLTDSNEEDIRLTQSLHGSLMGDDDLTQSTTINQNDSEYDEEPSTVIGLSTILEQEDSVDGFRSNLKDAKEQLQLLKVEKEALQALQKQTAHELSNLEKVNHVLTKESDERKVEYTQCKIEVNELKKTLIEREQELEIQKQHSIQLEALLKEKDLQLNGMKDENQELKDKVDSYQEELKSAKDDNNNIMQSLQHTQTFLQEAKTEGEQCHQMLTQCKDMLIDAEERREQLRLVIEQKEKEIANVLKDNRKLKDVLEKYECQLDPSLSRQSAIHKGAPFFVSLFWLFF